MRIFESCLMYFSNGSTKQNTSTSSPPVVVSYFLRSILQGQQKLDFFTEPLTSRYIVVVEKNNMKYMNNKRHGRDRILGRHGSCSTTTSMDRDFNIFEVNGIVF
jgi:hypothetical protein